MTRGRVAGSHAGPATATVGPVNTSGRRWSGWVIRGWIEWLIALISCGVFLLLEGGLLYSYYQFLKHGQW